MRLAERGRRRRARRASLLSSLRYPRYGVHLIFGIGFNTSTIAMFTKLVVGNIQEIVIVYEAMQACSACFKQSLYSGDAFCNALPLGYFGQLA